MNQRDGKNGVYLLNYLDYRAFLREWYEEEKSLRDRYSFQEYSHELGFNNRAFIQNIIQGRRDFPKNKVESAAKFFGFNKEEKRYWWLLWELSKAKNNTVKQGLWEKLQKEFHHGKSVQIEADAYELFRSWFVFPVREVLLETQPGESLEGVGQLLRPTIRMHDVEKAVEVLKRTGHIAFENGKWTQKEAHVLANPGLHNMAIRHYQKSVMELGMRSFDEVPPEERDCSSLMVGLSDEGVGHLKVLISKFRSEVVALANEYGKEGSVDRVHQINIQAFPVSEPLHPKKEYE